MTLEELLGKLDGVRRSGRGYVARCPAHDDRHPSLSVSAGDEQPIVLHCHTNQCTPDDIMAALGLSTADLAAQPHRVIAYEYQRADGSTAYIVDRWANPKTFRVRGTLPSPAERVLYQLPALEWARSAGAVVYYVEGEKDADALVQRGHVATTNFGGTGGWLPHYAEQLEGLNVIVIADNDPPGRAHGRAVVADLRHKCNAVRLVVVRHGKDISDQLAAGYGVDELEPLSEQDELPAVRADNVTTRRIEWAWRKRFPFGKLSTVEGDPGDGKSLMTLDLTARWSSGRPMPDGSEHGGPYHVILVSAEDDEADTIAPRLAVAGARMDNVTMVTAGSTPDSPFTFANDLAALERLITSTGARIVVFDPLTAFMSSNVDSHNDLSVRQALWPLKSLAQRTGCAIIVVRHLNKGGTGVKAIYRGNGSIAFIGAARCGHAVARDPEDEPDGRLLATVKSNISRLPDTLRFRVESTPDGETPYIAWGGVSELTAQQALDGPRRGGTYGDDKADVENRVRKYEREFLMDILADGPKSWKEIVEIGRADGFTEHTLRRARAEAGLIKLMGADGQASVRWARPSTADAAMLTIRAPI